MSLESGIADLTTATNNLITYFNGKKASIDAAVAAAIAAVPETSRTWYVDQVVGLDTNAGTSAALPFKTLDKAIASTPVSGVCTVRLLSDYNLASGLYLGSAMMVIMGEGAVRTIYPKYYQTTDGAGVTSTVMGGFQLTLTSNQLEVRGCNLVFPSSAGQVPAPSANRTTSFVRTNGTNSIPPIVGLSLASVTVTKAVDFIGFMIGPVACGVALACTGTTFPSDFGGKFVGNVASGTASNAAPNVITNLGTL